MNNKNDRKLIALSVLVAVIMWAFVMTSTNPSLSKTVRGVPLTIKNQEVMQKEGYALVGKDEISSVNVKVEGSRSDLASLSSDDLVASVDLGVPTEGIKTLNIKVDGPSGIKVESTNPSNVNFKIEKIVKKDLPVEIKIPDKLKESKIINVSEQSTKKITVSGLRKNIDKVDKIILNIGKDEYLDGKIHDIEARPIDKSGKTVANVDLSQNDVSISFDVLQSKEVEIELDYEESLPKNMEVIEKKYSPKKVVIKGEKSIIDKIDKIKTEKIDLTNLKNNEFEKSLELVVPEAVEINDGDNFINVYIKIGKK
ncbi:MAG: CdaR family protein [Anaerococcus hydrogenalis]|uniref:CdaR family protein n=1 Tax=Anaerococcus hydrogenalis TaxID=33029 RepID=UPI0029065A48|nr:CdaR family protein [Anaerococcus hydrogenalis]MDU3687955.1 CdaR family protein [Anaerococcus hydrogenalis]